MWEEAFLARLAHKRVLADQGHVELEDQLGPERDLGPAVRTGLLKPAPPCCPLQRYNGHVPTRKGARYLDYCGEHHLITVRAGRVSAFEAALALDPLPGEVFVPPAPPLPFGLERAPPARLRQRGKTGPLADLAYLREEERRCWLRDGYTDFEEVRAALSIPEEALMASGLFRQRIEGQDLHALPLVPQGLGAHFLLLVVPWDLLFIRPEMARALFLLIDRDRAAEWTTVVANIGLPMGDAWKVPARQTAAPQRGVARKQCSKILRELGRPRGNPAKRVAAPLLLHHLPHDPLAAGLYFQHVSPGCQRPQI